MNDEMGELKQECAKPATGWRRSGRRPSGGHTGCVHSRVPDNAGELVSQRCQVCQGGLYRYILQADIGLETLQI